MTEHSDKSFQALFQELTGHAPMRWQQALYERHFAKGDLPAALDIPTGLGKTSVLALWMIAHLQGINIPRRLVYVVDRRAVVDQATSFAETLYHKAHTLLGADELSISTLRGQHVDNRKWLDHPASPAIIIGTIDMIGSRLLFEGYGVSRKMRPYHAGLLGIDSLFVLDESHLVPPFQGLLRQIAGGPDNLSGTKQPPFNWHLQLISLSATGTQAAPGTVFSLTDDLWRSDPIARKRFTARKELTLHESGQLEKNLAERAWALSGPEVTPRRVLIFCNSRLSAQKVHDDLSKRLEKRRRQRKEAMDGWKSPIELLVGQRRVFERDQVADRLADLGFLEPSAPPLEPTFLVATAAGEVGVDLDADDLVCDLVPWERLVQRLGRVNRRGNGSAQVEIWAPADLSKHEILLDTRELLKQALGAKSHLDVSPAGLSLLKREAGGAIEAASTPPPRYPALTRAELDSWSLTSLDVVDPSKPRVQPWLRGWVEDEPRTTLVWRRYLPTRYGPATKSERGARQLKVDVERYFESAPVSLAEQLEAPTRDAVNWLQARVRSLSRNYTNETVVAYVLNSDLTLRERPAKLAGTGWGLQVRDLRSKDKSHRDLLMAWLTQAVVVVSAKLEGLQEGLLVGGSPKSQEEPDRPERPDDAPTEDSHSDQLEGSAQKPEASDDSLPICADTHGTSFHGVPFSINEYPIKKCDELPEKELKDVIYRFATEYDDDGQPLRELVVERLRIAAPTSEEGRSVTRFQLLDDHQEQAESCAKELAHRLGLNSEQSAMLSLAARFHDEGKRAENWQRAFSVPPGKVGVEFYAKTPGPVLFSVLAGYRHELGTLIRMQSWIKGRTKEPSFSEGWQALSSDHQELMLHMTGAHHGGARPMLRTDGCPDAEPSQLEVLAHQVALRFAAMQQQWGPWGLAWWEALLRSVDQKASRENKNSKGGPRD